MKINEVGALGSRATQENKNKNKIINKVGEEAEEGGERDKGGGVGEEVVRELGRRQRKEGRGIREERWERRW